MDFDYIKANYKVPAQRFREVNINKEKGVIVGVRNAYLLVVFYNKKDKTPLPCHPTWNVDYLETFNNKPPTVKNPKSKARYNHYLSLDSDMTFFEYLQSNWVLK